MLYTMKDILSPTNLLAAYQKQASIHVSNPFFDFFNAKTPENVDGETFEFVVYDDTRTPAPINTRGAPARSLTPEGAEKKYITPLHVFNEMTIPSNAVEFLREENSPNIQQRGVAELGRQMDRFAKRHALARVIQLAHAFRGNVYYDANGMPLESSSSAQTTVPTGVPAANRSQLAHASNSSTDIITIAWDSPTATILSDLRKIRKAAEYDKVPMPKHVWLPEVGIPWICNNDEIADFVRFGSSPSETKNMLDKMAGDTNMLTIGSWTFHFTSTTYVGADESTVRPLLADTAAVITPDVNDGDWFLHAEASETIPTEDGVLGGFNEYFSNTQKVFGDFAYARIDDNPLRVTMRMGMNFLYAFKEPKAVYYPTVDF